MACGDVDMLRAALPIGPLSRSTMNRNRAAAALAAIAIATLAACRPADPSAALEPCRLPGIERELRCGSVRMPEDPDAHSGKLIDIRFAVVPAIARNKLPDPVFVLAGGPGQAGTRVARQIVPVFADLNARRDLVLIDQRGTGGSNPLECRLDESSLAATLEPSQQVAMLADCLKSLPADPRQYGSWIAVRDFDAIRARLGAEQVNLWGGSYGTRVALEYMRQYPDRVRSAVLDGVAPPDMRLPVSFSIDADASLAAMSKLCADDERCHARYPRFDEGIARLLERGGAEIRVAHPLTGRVEPLRLERRIVASLLRVPLYAPQLGALLPHALAEASRGDYTALVALSAALASGVSENFAVGMHFAVICAEDLPRIDAASRAEAARTRFGTIFVELYQQACDAVPVRPVPAGFYGVPPAKTPILILSGGLDPATPPRHGALVAEKLGNAKHLVAPHLGHGISSQACAPQLITRFVREASSANVDGDCLARVPAPPFFVPIEPQATGKTP
jgi:pimeloyl-ACP methyl ester carboxylesterase